MYLVDDWSIIVGQSRNSQSYGSKVEPLYDDIGSFKGKVAELPSVVIPCVACDRVIVTRA